ncbi:ankyrin repeat-containing protein BDA1 [Eucalyptus grandis]|uniref:ankyrin repeat-containing protein BDA1 n=1 Tax=Eucalyptus grandis TaxID=71139 RepID=UPI00192EF42C|nr:ankyrin repeat-containing protein BDA1 [Eucalyptus grandis]
MARGLAQKEEKKVRESRLQLAIEHDDVDELHNLIEEEPELLDRLSKHPFPTTPLHIAAAAGKTEVAMEMVILKPSHARKLNPKGYSPVHLALQHQHYNIVRALISHDLKLIRVPGRGGITPLHYVAEKKGDNELELLVEFLCTCESSIEDLTSQCETVVHVALKNDNLKAFEFLFGWLKQFHLMRILRWKDKDGNTALHIAAKARQPQPKIIKLLSLWTDVQAKNSLGETAMDIVNSSNHQDVVKRPCLQGLLCIFYGGTPSLLQLISRREWLVEEWARIFYVQNESARNIILVVSTLIATATYQAALSPPGGYWQDSSSNSPTYSTVVTANSTEIANGKPHQAGKMILSGSRLYVFTFLNSMTFLISSCIIIAAAVPLVPDTTMTCFSMFILAANYFLSLAMGFQNSNDVGLNLIGGFSMVAMYLFLGLCFMIRLNHFQVRRKINATRRRVGNF